MNDGDDKRAPGDESLLAGVADDYVARLKRGETPSAGAYVEQHPELAEEIRALLPTLRAMTAAGAPDEPPAEALEEWLEDRTLGDFRILREIGRGGMGTVYEAEQLSLGRRVALKVLPLAALLDPRLLQRFKHEALAAAQLHHNHIVPVHAVGCERGVHYYAMSYIEGASLGEVIAELCAKTNRNGMAADPGDVSSATALARQLTEGAEPANAGGRPSNGTRGRAFFRSVAWLGKQAAEALEHAHSMGVVHRDIKPANLLLDEQGRLWVADFGLAHYRTAGAGSLTLPGDLLGTVRYMSPEQAAGQSVVLDQRTDLYSLGVTLYELLCLRPAFEGDDRQELLRQVMEEEPPPPRRLNPALPVDLETILLKATAKEPAHRYETAAELAADFGRFLEDRPIVAHRPGLGLRLRRWTQHHVGLMSAGLAGLLLVSAGLGVMNWLLARERAATRTQRDAALTEQQRADANYQLALEVLERGVLDVLNDRLPRQGRITEGDRRLLQQALDFYEGFLAQNEGSREARATVGHAYHRVARIQRELGQFSAAEAAYRRSRRTFEALLRENPDAHDYRLTLANLWVEYGRMLNEAGRHLEAREAARRALEESQRLGGTNEASAAEQQTLGDSQGLLGETWQHLHRPAEAAKAHAAHLARVQAQAGAVADQSRTLQALADSHRGLAEAAAAREDWATAEQHFRVAVRHYHDLRAREPRPPRHRAGQAAAQAGLGRALQAQGRWREAEETAWDAFAEQRALAEEFPGQPAYRIGLIRMSAQMARLFLALGRPAEAEHRVNAALAIGARFPVATQCHPETLEVMPGLYQAAVEVFAAQGKEAEAQAARAAGARYEALARLAHVVRQAAPREEAQAAAQAVLKRAPLPAPEEQERLVAIAAALREAGRPAAAPLPETVVPVARLPHPAPGGRLTPGAGARLWWPVVAGAVAHLVYLGSDPDHLRLVGRVETGQPCELALPNVAGARWQAWRVDGLLADGRVARGPVWSFSTGRLVAWWPVEPSDREQLRDASGHGHDGVFEGRTTVAEDPERGSVLCFDGTPGQGVVIPPTADLDLQDGFTLAAWVLSRRPDSKRDQQAASVLIGKGNSTWRLLVGAGNRPHLQGTGLRTTSLVRPSTMGMGVKGRRDLPSGQWHHVAITFDGQRLTLYTDGIPEARELLVSGRLQSDHSPVIIGDTRPDPDSDWKTKREFTGLVDDLRIYDAPLPPNDLRALLSAPLPATEEAPAWATNTAARGALAGVQTGADAVKTPPSPTKTREVPDPLQARQPLSVLRQRAVCDSQGLLGETLRWLGRSDEALVAHQRQLAAARALTKDSANDPDAFAAEAAALRGLASVQEERGEWKAAERNYRAAVERHAASNRGGLSSANERFACSVARSHLGNVLREAGRLTEAEAALKQALATQLSLLESRPGSLTVSEAMGDTALCQARWLADAGLRNEAVRFTRDYLAYDRDLPAAVREEPGPERLRGAFRDLLCSLDENVAAIGLLAGEPPAATGGSATTDSPNRPTATAPAATASKDGARPLKTRPTHPAEGWRRRPGEPAPLMGGNLVTGENARLRWAGVTGAVVHRVYLGPDPDHLALLGEVQGTAAREMRLPQLAPCRWYAWRVEAEARDGSVVTGPVWAFSSGRLVAWWPFERDDITRARDASDNEHHGVFHGDAHVILDPRRGPVLDLDDAADGYVDCGADPAFNLTNGFTLSAWIRPRSLTGKFFPAIITKGDKAWRLQGQAEGHGVCLHLQGVRTSAAERNFGGLTGVSPVDDEVWRHVAAVFDGHRASLYVDGRLEDRALTFAGRLSDTDAPVRIGNNHQATYPKQRFFFGWMDDIRIFEAALGREEVEAVRRGEQIRLPPKPGWAR